MSSQEKNCMICGLPLQEFEPDSYSTKCECRNCGRFQTKGWDYPSKLFSEMQLENRAAVAHGIRKRQHAVPLLITREFIDESIRDGLPSIKEQSNRLLYELGTRLQAVSFGKTYKFNLEELPARIGARDPDDVVFLFSQLESRGLVRHEVRLDPKLPCIAALTFPGWEKFEGLKSSIDSRDAFMAMGYGDTNCDKILEVFKAATRQTGFILYRLDERPEAGIIDNRMRVAIRTSRFVIADITTANLGAYWEAGFAEGLEKPVIYTCSREEFDNKKRRHFDVEHSQFVIWDLARPERASEDLKATIRETIPEEAIMKDDKSADDTQ